MKRLVSLTWTLASKVAINDLDTLTAFREGGSL